MSEEKEEIENGETSLAAETSSEKRIGCAHYKRRAKFVVSKIFLLFCKIVTYVIFIGILGNSLWFNAQTGFKTLDDYIYTSAAQIFENC